MQHAGVTDDGKVGESAFDVVADPAGVAELLADDVHGGSVAVQVGGVPGIGGIVDAQAELGGPADRVGDEVLDKTPSSCHRRVLLRS